MDGIFLVEIIFMYWALYEPFNGRKLRTFLGYRHGWNFLCGDYLYVLGSL
jgi:hypothetical protein